MKKLLNILIISMLLLILIFPTKVLATDIDELIGKGQNFLSKGDPLENVINVDELQSTSKNIYNLLLTIGIAIAVIVGAILGIKIITAEVEEKAKLKEMIIPYILGCVIVFSAFSIWKTIVQIGSNIEQVTNEQFTEGEKWVANLYNTYGNFIPLDGNGNIDEKTSTNNIKDFIEKYKNKYSSSSEYYQDGMVSRRKNIFKAENRKWYNAGTTIEYNDTNGVLLMKNLIKYKRAALAEIAEIEDSTYYEYVESLWDNFIKGVKKEPFDGPVYVN